MSNFDQIMANLDRLIDSINLTDTTSPAGKKMAVDVLDTMTDGIQRRTIDKQVDPDNNPLADNAPSYRAKPAKGSKIIGFLTGEMLSDQQMKGDRTFEPSHCSQEFGITDFAKRKAQWFTRGSQGNPPSDIEASGAKNQPSRPFYDLDDEIKDTGLQVVNKALEQLISTFNGGIV